MVVIVLGRSIHDDSSNPPKWTECVCVCVFLLCAPKPMINSFVWCVSTCPLNDWRKIEMTWIFPWAGLIFQRLFSFICMETFDLLDLLDFVSLHRFRSIILYVRRLNGTTATTTKNGWAAGHPKESDNTDQIKWNKLSLVYNSVNFDSTQ